MNKLFFYIVLVSFPILIYFVLSSINIFISKKYDRNIFIVTMFISMYLVIRYDCYNPLYILLFSNIPILISYYKKEGLLGIELSLIFTIFVILNDYSYMTIVKLFVYYITYLFLCKKSSFSYLYVKICSIIQGLFISLEYRLNINNLIYSFIIIIIIFSIVFLIIYLFKVAENITNMYEKISNMKKEIDVKNSLFKLTHEVKNPIAVCKGYLDMINLNDYNSSYRYVEIIKGEINRSLNIMNDFMECSRVKINKEEFDLSLLLESVYESFKLLCKNKKIKINYNYIDDEIYINGDYHRLEQVLVNIIKNSMEAINENGVIDIDFVISNHDVIIKIKDNGIGMNAYELENVKEMFYTTKRDGTGLGVALSNEIVLLHNGSMEYESVKNKGTTCSIRIPMEG